MMGVHQCRLCSAGAAAHLLRVLPPLKSCCTALLALGGATGGEVRELRAGEKVRGLVAGGEDCVAGGERGSAAACCAMLRFSPRTTQSVTPPPLQATAHKAAGSMHNMQAIQHAAHCIQEPPASNCTCQTLPAKPVSPTCAATAMVPLGEPGCCSTPCCARPAAMAPVPCSTSLRGLMLPGACREPPGAAAAGELGLRVITVARLRLSVLMVVVRRGEEAAAAAGDMSSQGVAPVAGPRRSSLPGERVLLGLVRWWGTEEAGLAGVLCSVAPPAAALLGVPEDWPACRAGATSASSTSRDS
jgi:hypothetical protein